MRLRFSLFACGVLALAPRVARAGGPLGKQGEPITTSSYGVDVYQGPVLATARIIGLAGAYAPIGQDSEGMNYNAAAPAVRDPWSNDKFDYDVTAGITFPSSVDGTDFDNNGTKGFAYDNFYFVNAGGEMLYGPYAVGASVNLQQYDLDRSSSSASSLPNVRLRLVTGHVLAAYSMLHDQLVVGAGVRVAGLGVIDTTGAEKELLTMSGFSPEIGVVWAPKKLPVRFGMTTRGPVRGDVQPSRVTPDANDDLKVGSTFLPDHIELPAEMELGVAYQFGQRPLNMGWKDWKSIPKRDLDAERRVVDGKPEDDKTVGKRLVRRQYEATPRSKVLLLASVLFTARTHQAVGFESFLEQKVDRSGLDVSVSPRAAVEVEAIHNWLQLRGGSYLEPTRFRQSSARIHGTTGFDVKVLTWNVFGLFDHDESFRVGAVGDLARDYFGWSITAGLWH